LVARLVRDEEVVGSNPAYPTTGSRQVIENGSAGFDHEKWPDRARLDLLDGFWLPVSAACRWPSGSSWTVHASRCCSRGLEALLAVLLVGT